MKIGGITTIDSEISFGECDIREVPEEIKKLFPDQNLIKVSEKGKSYILNTDYIVLLFTSLWKCRASDRLCSSRRTPVTKSFACFGGDFSRGLLSISCHKQFSFLNYLTCYFHKELERSYQNVLVKIYYSLNAFICQYVVQERSKYIVETQYIVFWMWDKIEHQLKLRDWSMYRLAKESGIHQSNFSNLKAGRLKEMSWTNMCKIADALKVSLDEFR